MLFSWGGGSWHCRYGCCFELGPFSCLSTPFVSILPTLIVSGLLFPSLGQLSLFLLDVSYVPSCFAGLSSAGTSPLDRVGTVFFGWFSDVSNS